MSQYQVVRRDPLAELSSTLHTRQSAACDGEELKMECPSGTKISIQLVQYGRLTPDDQVCPANIRYPGTSISKGENEEKCLILEAIRTVEERCHGRESCTLTASPESLAKELRDPCPQVRKYVEVLYKCKPASFRSRVVCGGEQVSLSCQEPDTRLAIFSTSFSTPASGHVFCPLPGRYVGRKRRPGLYHNLNLPGISECKNYPVTDKVSDLCHGYHSCTFKADPYDLEANPCQSFHLTLKTTFACVDKSVFHAKFVDRVTTTTEPSTTTTMYKPTTTTVINSEYDNLSRIPEYSTSFWNIQGRVDVEAKPLEPKPSSEKDNLPNIIEDGSSFAKESKSKLLLFGTMIFSICLLSILLFIFVKIYQFYQPNQGLHPHHHLRSQGGPTDLDTVSSELDLSIDYQMHETPTVLISQPKYGTVGRHQKPKGILKNSKTSENLRLYSNPAEDNGVKYSTLGRHVKSPQSDFQSTTDLVGTAIHEPVILSEPLCEDRGSHVMLIQAVEPAHRSPLPVTSDRVGHARLINSALSSPVSVSSLRACPVTVCSVSRDVIVGTEPDR